MAGKDISVGSVLSRREVVAFLGATGAVWLMGGGFPVRQSAAGKPGPACVVRPEQTEGPYFVDERLQRSDIRADPSDGQIKAGTPLVLTLLLSRLSPGNCQPLPGAQVDLWHCDMTGVYSDVRDPWFNTVGQKFLRGYQMTDARGEVRFVTVFPGWYPGRAVHMHFKIRTTPTIRKSFEFTSQLYFDDAVTDHIHASPLYAARGPRTARNRHDRIFRQGGDQLVLTPTLIADGYAATFEIGLQLP